MAAGSFSIILDQPRGLMEVTLRGDWTMAIFDAYHAGLIAGVTDLIRGGTRHGELIVFVDMREKGVLPRDVAEAMRQTIRPDAPSRRIAYLVKGALHKLQARRLATDPRIEVFESEAEARAWLAE